jgi:hypothetical protein
MCGPRTFAVTNQIFDTPLAIEKWIIPVFVVCATIVRFWGLNYLGMGLFRDEARHGALARANFAGNVFCL